MSFCVENEIQSLCHIHILLLAPSYLSPAKMAQYLKGKSSYRLQRPIETVRCSSS
ncbi:MAG: hypothetical protein D3911_06555 [Candidatus Electrothrix sp. AW3_4]|nr:hypothetical protein [Candidatus Electrothrix gigas]